VLRSTAALHLVYADLDPDFNFDADPDSYLAFVFDAFPDQTFHFMRIRNRLLGSGTGKI
jgi:hypothetical protein